MRIVLPSVPLSRVPLANTTAAAVAVPTEDSASFAQVGGHAGYWHVNINAAVANGGGTLCLRTNENVTMWAMADWALSFQLAALTLALNQQTIQWTLGPPARRIVGSFNTFRTEVTRPRLALVVEQDAVGVQRTTFLTANGITRGETAVPMLTVGTRVTLGWRRLPRRAELYYGNELIATRDAFLPDDTDTNPSATLAGVLGAMGIWQVPADAGANRLDVVILGWGVGPALL